MRWSHAEDHTSKEQISYSCRSFFSLIAFLSAFIWESVKTVTVILHLASSHGEDPLGAFEVISIIDTFLRGAAFFVISVGLYELIIEDVVMPARLIVHNIHDPKATLVSMIVLAVTFLEHLVAWKYPHGTLYVGIAITLVSASLIAFSYFSGQDYAV